VLLQVNLVILLAPRSWIDRLWRCFDAARSVMHTPPMARAGMLDFTFTELLPCD
jgi:hypothetical protein